MTTHELSSPTFVRIRIPKVRQLQLSAFREKPPNTHAPPPRTPPETGQFGFPLVGKTCALTTSLTLNCHCCCLCLARRRTRTYKSKLSLSAPLSRRVLALFFASAEAGVWQQGPSLPSLINASPPASLQSLSLPVVVVLSHAHSLSLSILVVPNAHSLSLSVIFVAHIHAPAAAPPSRFCGNRRS